MELEWVVMQGFINFNLATKKWLCLLLKILGDNPPQPVEIISTSFEVYADKLSRPSAHGTRHEMLNQ